MLVIDSLNVLQLRTSLSVAGVADNVMFNVEDRILVENLYKFRGYRAKNSKFSDKGWIINGLNYLLEKLRNIGTTARYKEVDDVRVENVDTVNDLVLSHKCALNASNHASNCEGDRHSSLVSVQHYSSGFTNKVSEEMVCAGTHCSNCVHQSDLLLVLQGRVGAHTLGVVGNTKYVLLQIPQTCYCQKL